MAGKASAHGQVLRANMRRLLDERGMCTADFCELAGIPRQAYFAAFGRDRGPTLIIVKQWADVLGVGMSELLKEEA